MNGSLGGPYGTEMDWREVTKTLQWWNWLPSTQLNETIARNVEVERIGRTRLYISAPGKEGDSLGIAVCMFRVFNGKNYVEEIIRFAVVLSIRDASGSLMLVTP